MIIDALKKYFEDIEILHVEYDIEETEPSILFRVKGQELYCFYPDMREKFLPGKTYNVLFNLASGSDLKISEEKCKYVKPIYWNSISFTTSYTICGEVVDLIHTRSVIKDGKQYEMFNCIIDCGFFVLVGLPYYFKTKIGEYIQDQGRLDISTLEDLLEESRDPRI